MKRDAVCNAGSCVSSQDCSHTIAHGNVFVFLVLSRRTSLSGGIISCVFPYFGRLGFITWTRFLTDDVVFVVLDRTGHLGYVVDGSYVLIPS